jgi:hypothetical protein
VEEVFAEEETVGEIGVELAIGMLEVAMELTELGDGEHALKNRPKAAEPMHASKSRKKLRRDISFNSHLHHHSSETKPQPSTDSYITFTGRKKARKCRICQII